MVGTRASALARAQTGRACELIGATWPGVTCEIRPIVTHGDRTQASGEPLPEIGGKGLFTAELEQALRDGDVDLAVHSLKDLPTEEADGIALGAVCLREDVRDCLVSREGVALHALPEASVVGTSSLRRAAQLLALRPDLAVRSIRGNVETRIRKVREGEFDASLLAAAGIVRLGLEREVAEWLDVDTMLPAPGQGALAVQCRADDAATLELLDAVDDPVTRAATTAERAFLRALGAGCTAPVAAYAEAAGGGAVRLVGLVASPDGRVVVRVTGTGDAGSGRRASRARGARRGRRGRPRGDPWLNGRWTVGASSSRARRRRRGRSQRSSRSSARRSPSYPSSGSRRWQARPFGQRSEISDASTGSSSPARTRSLPSATSSHDHSTRESPRSALPPRRLSATSASNRRSCRTGSPATRSPHGLGDLRGVRILLPQADAASPETAVTLRAMGADVVEIAVYRTHTVEQDPAALAELRSADAVVLASGSAARSLARQGGAGGALVVCIGPKTADVARECGLEVGLVAHEATTDGIIQALVSHFGEI